MSDKIIELGIICLLMYTPLGFGGSEFAVTLLEFVSGVLLLVWLAKIFARRRQSSHRTHPVSLRTTGVVRGKPTRTDRRNGRHRRMILPAFLGIIGVFCALILLQLFPLPGWLVNVLSPGTYRLYAEGASQTAAAIPRWLSFSVCSHATEVEFSLFLAYAALFVVLINTLRSSKQITRLVYVIIAVGLCESIYGFSQLSGQKNWQLVGTFVNRNHLAGYLEMVIPLVFGVVFVCLEERGSAPLKKFVNLFEEKYLKAILLLFVALVMICALLLTGSRGGIVSFTLGMIFLCLLAYARRLLRKWALVILIFVLLAFGGGVLIRPERIIHQLSALTKPEAEESFQLRWEVWKSTLPIARDFPLLGSGLGTFAHLFRRYQQFPSDLLFTHAENDYLQLLTETGIIGAFLMLGAGCLFFYQTLTAWKRQRSRWAIAIGAGGLSAMFSLALHSSVDFNLHIPSNALLFSVVAAISYVAAHSRKSKGRRSGRAALRGGQKVEDRKYGSGQAEERKAVGSRYYRGLIISAVVLVLTGLYLFRVAESYYAFVNYEKFVDAVSQVKQGNSSAEQNPAVDPVQPDQLISYVQKAIRHDRNNADYYYSLGSYLYWYYTDRRPPENHDRQNQGLQEAETWLQQAVWRDPANPWYYYELGRLSYHQQSCISRQAARLSELLNTCPPARYFLAALQNAPNNLFLRREVGRWYYHYHPEMAYQMMQTIIVKETGRPIKSWEGTLAFAKFLYDAILDAQSDLVSAQLQKTPNSSDLCQDTTNKTFSQPLGTHGDGAERIELGNDDGSAEWRTYLSSETMRVKKVICLPDNLADYHYATLKLFMSNGGNQNFIAQIMIDDQVVKQFDEHYNTSYLAQWYEIPFDKTLLQGKTRIHVYIRVASASVSYNYLVIWGDQQPSTTHSEFNFRITDDLSFDEGIQIGEYMIRLVLNKQ